MIFYLTQLLQDNASVLENIETDMAFSHQIKRFFVKLLNKKL